VPWGLLVTPFQVGRNVVGFFTGPNPNQPSPALEQMIRLHLAAEALQQQKTVQPAPQARGF
jgi:hypothetical protein